MREILFRGKRVENGEWVEGYYVKCRRRHYILELYNEFGYDERWETSMWVEVIPETIGQYTGLDDKNGTKIFEGDILKTINIYNQNECVGKVYFDEYQWFGAHDYLGYVDAYCDIEIIGNIHDNPELLGQHNES